MSLLLEIVTPEAKAFSGEVESVVLPGTEGEFGVLPGHEYLMTEILPGELEIASEGRKSWLAVGGGFVEARADRVTVLTDMAIRAEDIDEHAADEARRRAENALAESNQADEAARAILRRSLAQIHVKRRRSR
ncbi:MAG: ATP synthase F1 subunit epsilon [Verrucomicrobiae bacterium]|nr:ATP synthase F1 subunit epsilon [Verrucomicrobiae bacterium]